MFRVAKQLMSKNRDVGAIKLCEGNEDKIVVMGGLDGT